MAASYMLIRPAKRSHMAVDFAQPISRSDITKLQTVIGLHNGQLLTLSTLNYYK